jgi:serine/threonine protein kinase
MARKEPFNQHSIEKLKKAIKNNERKPLSDTYSKNLRDLVAYCLRLDQATRPSIEQLLRHPLVRAELDNILKDFIPLTYIYQTALSTHLVIEQVVEIQCMLAKSTDDYGFAVTDESLIRVAKTPYTFLLQAELRAINSGLEYR